MTLATLGYVLIFPSTLAYLFFNRGVALIGPNRAAPFFHLVPVFGSAMAILLLGEKLQLFHLIGYALVLAGVVIASRQGSAVEIIPELRRDVAGFRFRAGQASVAGRQQKKPEGTTDMFALLKRLCARAGAAALCLAPSHRRRAGALPEPQHHAGAAVRRRQRHRHHDAPDLARNSAQRSASAS